MSLLFNLSATKYITKIISPLFLLYLLYSNCEPGVPKSLNYVGKRNSQEEKEWSWCQPCSSKRPTLGAGRSGPKQIYINNDFLILPVLELCLFKRFLIFLSDLIYSNNFKHVLLQNFLTYYCTVVLS